MSQYSTEEAYFTSFHKIYISNIKPKVERLDLFLKTTPTPYNPVEVAEVLDSSEEEIKDLMKAHEISSINKIDFFTLLINSSSYICKLIQRQWKYTNLEFYTPEVISDIYELNPLKIYTAFNDLNISQVEVCNLEDVFMRIHVPIYTFNS